MARLRAMVISQASTEPREAAPPRVEEALLEDLLGVGGLAEHAEQQRVEPRRMAAVELLEGARVPAADGLEHGSVLGRAGHGAATAPVRMT